MSTRQIASRGLAMLLAVAGAVIASPAHADSVTYEMLVDTSSLTPGPGGYVDISLNPTIAQSPATVSVQVFNPITDGTLGAANTVYGTATGDLTTPMGVTADNSATMNELRQNFAVASFFDVFITLSGPEIGPGATGPWSGTVFSLSIFDSEVNFAGASLTVNPDMDRNGNPIVDGTVGISTTGPQVQVIELTPIPEPSSFVLMSLGTGAVVAVGRRRFRRR